MRTIIIGDIHGCKDELVDLVSKLKTKPQDHLVFVGDLVDKGPDSAGVVKYVSNLRHSVRVSLVLGNHEETHLRWLSKDEHDRKKMKRNESIALIQKDLGPEDVQFLRSSSLFLPLPEHNAVVVHAGIPEFLQELPTQEDVAAAKGKRRKRIMQACRIRYVTEEGRFVGLKEIDKDKHYLWSNRYDGRFGHVYYGHEASPGIQRGTHATGIDTGCVYGGHLSAVVLDTDKPRRDFVQVPSRKAYAKILQIKDLL